VDVASAGVAAAHAAWQRQSSVLEAAEGDLAVARAAVHSMEAALQVGFSFRDLLLSLISCGQGLSLGRGAA
jgi:hypothetical protein